MFDSLQFRFEDFDFDDFAWFEFVHFKQVIDYEMDMFEVEYMWNLVKLGS